MIKDGLSFSEFQCACKSNNLHYPFGQQDDHVPIYYECNSRITWKATLKVQLANCTLRLNYYCESFGDSKASRSTGRGLLCQLNASNKTFNMKVNCKFKGSSAYAVLHMLHQLSTKRKRHTHKKKLKRLYSWQYNHEGI